MQVSACSVFNKLSYITANSATYGQRLVDAIWLLIRDVVFLVDYLSARNDAEGRGDAALIELIHVRTPASVLTCAALCR
jgi:hypothetical protein